MRGEEGYDAQIERRIEKLEDRVDALRSFQSWVMGGAAAVAFIAGIYSKTVASLFLGHPVP